MVKEDFQLTSIPVEVPRGARTNSEFCTEILIGQLVIDDNILENDEEFMLVLQQSSLPRGVTVGLPDRYTITIADNDCKLNTKLCKLLKI